MEIETETKVLVAAVGAWCVIIGVGVGLFIARPKRDKEPSC